MIWTIPSKQFNTYAQRLEKGNMLRDTGIIHSWLQEYRDIDFEPAEYFIVPKGADKSGRIVHHITRLNRDGFLIGRNLFGIYSPGAEDREKTYSPETRDGFRQAHAIAERTALSRGIFTLHGRSTAEVAVAEGFRPNFRTAYVAERLQHLHFLAHEVEQAPNGDDRLITQRQADAIGMQVQSAISSLETF